jgi:hypothetical protein
MDTHEGRCEVSTTDASPDTKAAGCRANVHAQYGDARLHPLPAGDSLRGFKKLFQYNNGDLDKLSTVVCVQIKPV